MFAAQLLTNVVGNSWDEIVPPSTTDFGMDATFVTSMPSFPMVNETPLWQPSLHSWELPIRYLPPTDIVDSLLIAVLQEQRSLNHIGTLSAARFSAPANMRGLLYCEEGIITVSDPVSNTLAEVLHNTRLSTLPEKAACLYVMHKLLCWQILPLLETYGQIPWPKLRDQIIRSQMEYATDEFREHFALSLNVNWPYRDIDVLMFEDGEVRVTPMFESHVSKLENWSLNAPFSTRYPELSEFCKFSGAGYTV
jgi:hypothetical protein